VRDLAHLSSVKGESVPVKFGALAQMAIAVEKSKVSELTVRLFSIRLYRNLFDVCSKQPQPRPQVTN